MPKMFVGWLHWLKILNIHIAGATKSYNSCCVNCFESQEPLNYGPVTVMKHDHIYLALSVSKGGLVKLKGMQQFIIDLSRMNVSLLAKYHTFGFFK